MEMSSSEFNRRCQKIFAQLQEERFFNSKRGGWKAYAARELGISYSHFSVILGGKRRITTKIQEKLQCYENGKKNITLKDFLLIERERIKNFEKKYKNDNSLPKELNFQSWMLKLITFHNEG